jgi:hypothetical protein
MRASLHITYNYLLYTICSFEAKSIMESVTAADDCWSLIGEVACFATSQYREGRYAIRCRIHWRFWMSPGRLPSVRG